MSDEVAECINDKTWHTYQIHYVQHEVNYTDDDSTVQENDNIVLNLHLQHLVRVTELKLLNHQIIIVGPASYDEENNALPNTNYTIRIPGSMLDDTPALEAYVLARLPPLGEILNAYLDVKPMISYASSICYDPSYEHMDFIIYGEFNVIKSEIFYKKNVLKNEYVCDCDDEFFNCGICLNGLEGGNECSRTLCDHVFHKSCLLPWMVMNNTCPMCREFIVRVGCH